MTRKRISNFFKLRNRHWDQFSVLLLISALFLRILLGIHFQGRVWIDEIWVVLEPAYRLYSHLSPVHILDWQQSIRSVLPPGIFYVLIQFLEIIGVEKGTYVLPILRILLCGAIFFSQIFFLKELLNALNLKKKKYFYIPVIVFFFSPELLHYSLSADLSVLGAPFLLLGLGYWVRWKRIPVEVSQSSQSLLYAGVFLALASLIRFQYGVFALGLFCAVFIKTKFQKTEKQKKNELLLLSAIGILAFLFQIGLDSLFYRKFTVTLYNYFTLNTSGGLAASFGTSPFPHGLEIFWRFASEPIALATFLLIPFALKKIPALYLTSLAFLLMHCLVGHKEYRFFYGAALVFSAMVPVLLLNLVELKKLKPQILMIFFILFLGFSAFRAAKKVGWQDFESPSYLETVAGSKSDLKGLISYGWGGIYSGGNFTLFSPKPYHFFISQNDIAQAGLDPAEFNYVIAPTSASPPCLTIVQEHLGATLYRCEFSEMKDFLKRK